MRDRLLSFYKNKEQEEKDIVIEKQLNEKSRTIDGLLEIYGYHVRKNNVFKMQITHERLTKLVRKEEEENGQKFNSR